MLIGVKLHDLDELQQGYHRTSSYDTRRPHQQNPKHFKLRTNLVYAEERTTPKGEMSRYRCSLPLLPENGHYGASCLSLWSQLSLIEIKEKVQSISVPVAVRIWTQSQLHKRFCLFALEDTHAILPGQPQSFL